MQCSLVMFLSHDCENCFFSRIFFLNYAVVCESHSIDVAVCRNIDRSQLTGSSVALSAKNRGIKSHLFVGYVTTLCQRSIAIADILSSRKPEYIIESNYIIYRQRKIIKYGCQPYLSYKFF